MFPAVPSCQYAEKAALGFGDEDCSEGEHLALRGCQVEAATCLLPPEWRQLLPAVTLLESCVEILPWTSSAMHLLGWGSSVG